jgi:2-C-methyl-D-erythritol 4-phosphate cytidylyltransferase
VTGPIAAIILAAGQGERFGGMKQFKQAAGKMVVEWTMEKYRDLCERVVLVVPYDNCVDMAERFNDEKVVVCAGGATRFESLRKGLALINDKYKVTLVVDGVCPCTPRSLIKELVHQIEIGFTASQPVVDAFAAPAYIRDKDAEGDELTIIKRDRMRFVRTPTAYKTPALQEAMRLAYNAGLSYGSCFTWYIQKYKLGTVSFVEGSPYNFKITFPGDMEKLKGVLKHAWWVIVG